MPTPNNYRRLEHSTRHIVPTAKKLGPADPDEVISITFAIRRRPGAPPLPDQDHWARTPPGSRHYITTEEFAAKYGASATDLDIVASPAASHNLTVVERSAAQRLGIVSGKVAHVSKALAVDLGRYEVPPRAATD